MDNNYWRDATKALPEKEGQYLCILASWRSYITNWEKKGTPEVVYYDPNRNAGYGGWSLHDCGHNLKVAYWAEMLPFEGRWNQEKLCFVFDRED